MVSVTGMMMSIQFLRNLIAVLLNIREISKGHIRMLGQKANRMKTLKNLQYPYPPCMEYIPTFFINVSHMGVNIPYMEHLGYIFLFCMTLLTFKLSRTLLVPLFFFLQRNRCVAVCRHAPTTERQGGPRRHERQV